MPIRLNARRAVIQRSTTARRVFRRIDNIRQEAIRCFGPNHKVVREPRPTKFGLIRPVRTLRAKRLTCQNGLPDVASRSLDDGAKSGPPPELLEPLQSLELLELLLYVGSVYAHTPTRRHADTPQICQ